MVAFRFALVLWSLLLLPAPSFGEVLINEVDYDQPGPDEAEFIELKNAGATPVDLSEYALELVNGSSGGATVYDTIDSMTGMLSPGDYFVVCANASNTPTCDLQALPLTSAIQNGAPDAIGLRRLGSLVDAVSYEGNTGAPYTEGVGILIGDDGSSFDVGIARLPDGTDSDDNSSDFVSQENTPGFSNDGPPSAVINEVDYDQPGTDNAEFIELKNNGPGSIDLSEYVVELVNGSVVSPSIYQTIDSMTGSLAAGDYFVICGNPTTVPQCDLQVLAITNGIQNGAADAIGLRHLGGLVDAVSYEGIVPGYVEGTALSTSDDGIADRASLSRLPDGIDTDDNEADFVLRTSTPGASNDSIVAVPMAAGTARLLLMAMLVTCGIYGVGRLAARLTVTGGKSARAEIRAGGRDACEAIIDSTHEA